MDLREVSDLSIESDACCVRSYGVDKPWIGSVRCPVICGHLVPCCFPDSAAKSGVRSILPHREEFTASIPAWILDLTSYILASSKQCRLGCETIFRRSKPIIILKGLASYL